MKNIVYVIIIFLFTLAISWIIMGNIVDNLIGYKNHTTNTCIYYEGYKWCPEVINGVQNNMQKMFWYRIFNLYIYGHVSRL